MQRSAVAFSKCRWEIFVCKQAQKLDLEQARRRGYVDANGSDTRSRCGPLRLVTDTNGARKVQRTGRTPLWRWASTKTFLFGRNYGAWLMPRARTSTTLRECGRYARTPRARERESARGGQRAGEGPDAGARHDERRPARRQADVSEEGDAEARAGGSECRASERESGTGNKEGAGAVDALPSWPAAARRWLAERCQRPAQRRKCVSSRSKRRDESSVERLRCRAPS